MKQRRSSVGLVVGAAVALILLCAAFAVYQLRPASASDPDAVSATLDPNQFVGEVREAYEVARDKPELLAQLDCYCGCEQHEGHKNLLDCFRTDHGAGCPTCTGEAVTAGQLADGGMPADKIREYLKTRYGHGD